MCHHLGSDGYKRDLIQNNDAIQEDSEEQSLSVDVNDFDPEHFSTFKMRLGLSAAPWDEYDKKEPCIINGFVNGDFDISNQMATGGNY